MKIDFTVSEEDYVALVERFTKTSTAQRGGSATLFWVLIGVSLVFALPAIVASGDPLRMAIALWPVLALPVVLTIILSPLKYWLVRRHVRRLLQAGEASGAIGEMSIELTPRALIGRNATGECHFYWTAVKSVAAGKGRLFIYLSNGAGYVISKSAFADDRQRYEFIAALREHSQLNLPPGI